MTFEEWKTLHHGSNSDYDKSFEMFAELSDGDLIAVSEFFRHELFCDTKMVCGTLLPELTKRFRMLLTEQRFRQFKEIELGGGG